MSTVPFTYYLHHLPTGMNYYGVRYRKGCHPRDLWTTYFSSSKKVKSLIEQYGQDSFYVEVRRVFSIPEEAREWESKVQRRLEVDIRDNWLNSHVQGGRFHCPGHSLETRQKISEKLTGVSKTEEHKRKISEKSLIDRKKRTESGWKMPRSAVEKARESNLGRKHNPEGVQRMRESKKGKIRYYRPDGSFYYDYPQIDNSHGADFFQ